MNNIDLKKVVEELKEFSKRDDIIIPTLPSVDYTQHVKERSIGPGESDLFLGRNNISTLMELS